MDFFNLLGKHDLGLYSPSLSVSAAEKYPYSVMPPPPWVNSRDFQWFKNHVYSELSLCIIVHGCFSCVSFCTLPHPTDCACNPKRIRGCRGWMDAPHSNPSGWKRLLTQLGEMSLLHWVSGFSLKVPTNSDVLHSTEVRAYSRRIQSTQR